jgi:hypothetical protein
MARRSPASAVVAWSAMYSLAPHRAGNSSGRCSPPRMIAAGKQPKGDPRFTARRSADNSALSPLPNKMKIFILTRRPLTRINKYMVIVSRYIYKYVHRHCEGACRLVCRRSSRTSLGIIDHEGHNGHEERQRTMRWIPSQWLGFYVQRQFISAFIRVIRVIRGSEFQVSEVR